MTRPQQIFTSAAAIAAGALLLARQRRESAADDLNGRVVLITGGSRGLGLELAREFGARGARVALVARDEAELQAAQRDLAEQGVPVFIVPADVREQGEVERAVQKVVTHYGQLDIVVNNAGVITVGPYVHMSLEDYEQAMKVHYWGPLYMILAALPHLRRSDAARIVNITSIGGKVAVPHLAPYSGSKFALVGLSDTFRAELAPEGIRVTTVIPGLMRTGSPINATFKGRQSQEFTWFSIGDSLPGLTMSSRRAARQIVDACRRGDATLVIGVHPKLVLALQGLMPGLVATAMSIAARMLPGPGGADGDLPRLGRQSWSRWSPSVLTRLGDKAAERNNETRPVLSIEATTAPIGSAGGA